MWPLVVLICIWNFLSVNKLIVLSYCRVIYYPYKDNHGIQSCHFMANRWGNNGNNDRLFWGSKITTDGDCSHEIKRRLLLGRKVMTNLDSIFKSRHSFANKGQSSQRYDFSSKSCMDVRVGQYRKLSTEEFMILNCCVEEDSWESLGQQGDPTSQS